MCALVCQAALGTEGTAASSAAPPTVAPATTSPASDGKGCRVVRLSDIGWTDVTATTALFSALLRHLGYRPEITVLSLPVTYASMKNRDIDVFLAWDPHPMNMRFNLRYLAGGDAVFGPRYGEAHADTNTRAGYSRECPNIGRLLANVSFTTAREPGDERHSRSPPAPEVAAASWLKANPAVVASVCPEK
jgi:ABC-type proline/glycine betaine transport system substrate-binding protein